MRKSVHTLLATALLACFANPLYAAGKPELTTGTVAGEFTPGAKYSYLYYFGAESGDSVVWYFETQSPAGQMITAACKPKKQCYVTGGYLTDKKIPKEIPETTSGSWRLVEVTQASRKKPKDF
jgi:hypothetical protein